MASHVSQCMAKTCMCDTWQAMCVTHGMPCVNMHATFEAYIYGAPIQFVETSKGGRRRKGKEEGRKGEEKGKKKRGEEKGGREEKKKKKEEKEGVSRSEETQTAKNSELRYER